MIKTYSTTSNAFVERPVKIYDKTAGAWVEAPSVKTYDSTAQAWIERLKNFLTLTVGSGFYHNSGNMVFCANETIHCDIKPTSSEISIEFSLVDDFTDPVIDCSYSFGYSDLCPSIASGFYSHACAEWVVKGYSNGSEVTSATIASGSNYAYATIFDEPKTVTLYGTFDEIRLVCEIQSFTNYSKFGKANTTVSNFSIDGKLYGAKTQAITS